MLKVETILWCILLGLVVIVFCREREVSQDSLTEKFELENSSLVTNNQQSVENSPVVEVTLREDIGLGKV